MFYNTLAQYINNGMLHLYCRVCYIRTLFQCLINMIQKCLVERSLGRKWVSILLCLNNNLSNLVVHRSIESLQNGDVLLLAGIGT